MKLEPLKDKISIAMDVDDWLGIVRVMHVKSAVEWYRHYRISKSFLKHDYPELFKKYYHQRRYATIQLSYEEWLLNKAFEDVISAKKDGGEE